MCIMSSNKVFKTLVLLSYIFKCSDFTSRSFGCEGHALSTDDGDELLASLQNLDMNAQKISDFLNGYKNEKLLQSKTKINLHPSLWSPEYYAVVNPKSLPLDNVTSSGIKVSKSAALPSRFNMSSTSQDLSSKIRVNHLVETRKSTYKIEKQDKSENEILGLGASSRTVVQHVVENNSTEGNEKDNALNWRKTSSELKILFIVKFLDKT